MPRRRDNGVNLVNTTEHLQDSRENNAEFDALRDYNLEELLTDLQVLQDAKLDKNKALYEVEKKLIAENERERSELQAKTVKEIAKQTLETQYQNSLSTEEKLQKIRLANLQKHAEQEFRKGKEVQDKLAKLQLEKSKDGKDKEKLEKTYEKWENAIKRYLDKEQEISEKNEKNAIKNQTLDALSWREASKEGVLKEKALRELGNTFKNVGTNLISGLAKTADTISNTIKDYVSYQQGVNARLQGIDGYDVYDNIYAEMAGDLLKESGLSWAISNKELLKNFNTLVDLGVGFNLEQRSLMMTLSDQIASTFDADNPNLLRLVRLQQQDTTAGRLGMEATLTQLFNDYFGDSSYLSQMLDTVSSSLLDAEALMGTKAGGSQEAASFEYIVQKWLGALSSVGTSDDTISSISSAINALGSGNISSFQSNPVSNLLLMAMANTNTSISDILANGMSAYSANTILSGVVSYLQEIGSSGNNIQKSALASTFGVSVSDLVAASNITQQTMDELAQSTMTYNAMLEELGDQLDNLWYRVPDASKLQNVYDNFTLQLASGIADNSATYFTWELASMLADSVGGASVTVPFAGQLNLANTIKAGMVGISALSQVGNLISGLVNGISLSGLKESARQLYSNVSQQSNSKHGVVDESFSIVTTTNKQSSVYRESLNNVEVQKQEVVNSAKEATGSDYIENIYKYLDEKLDIKMDAVITHLSSMSGLTAGVDVINEDYKNVVTTLQDNNKDSVSKLTEIGEDVHRIVDVLESIDTNTKVSYTSSGVGFNTYKGV